MDFILKQSRPQTKALRSPVSHVYKMIFPAVFLMAAMWTPVHAGEKASNLNLSTAVAQVARHNIPAVVHIEVTKRQEMTSAFSPFQNDPFFRHFFGLPDTTQKYQRELKGLGTGMIMDEKGHILTNNHVAGGATDIQVLLANGKQYPAKLVGTDPKTDLAVIKISTKELLPHVTFGDSDKIEVGEWVVAIGHPRGLDQTVTQGIISAKHRRGIMDPSNYQDFLQTDAAINPGNSGGPLLNLNGEVVGINAAIVSQSGGFEGIGFAIPSNMAIHIASELIAHGSVERGWFGAGVQDLTPQLARSFGLENQKGALIADVAKGGPANKAGIKRGDVIISYKGKKIQDGSSLRNEVAISSIGKEADVTVLRNGKEKIFSVKIGNIKDAIKMRASSVKSSLGVEVRPTTSKDVERYNLSSRQGVVITWLDPNGPLGSAGFEVDDILLEINGKTIKKPGDFAELISALKPRQRVTLLAFDHRSGRTGYVQVALR